MNKSVKHLIFFGFFAIFIALMNPQKVHAAGTFSISPTTGNYIRSCNQSVDINIDIASGETNAADIIVTYDTTKIEIIDAMPSIPGTQILPGNAFESYAGNTVNTLSGEIKLVGYSSGSTLSASATFASIFFKSKPLATNGAFSITFTGANPYNTLDSNIADAATSYDMLSGVSNATYTFSSGSCLTDTTPPTVTFSSPKNLQNNVPPNSPVTFSVSDSGAGVSLPSVEIIINGETYTAISPEVSVSGTPANYTFTVTPVTPFPTNSVSVISVTAEDAAGNAKTSSISINSGYSCPVTVTYVTTPGLCPSVAPTKLPDRISPTVLVKSTTAINISKDYTLVISTTDNNGLAPESFLLTIGKQSYSIASTPDRIKVEGNRDAYTFTISLRPEELQVNDEGKLIGSVKISDLEGNTRIEQLILQTTGRPPTSTGSTKGGSDTWQVTVAKTAVFYVAPSVIGAYLLIYGVMSTAPTVAFITDRNKKPIRFPRGYLLFANGTKRKLFGGFNGRLHGKIPQESVSLVVQKYGYISSTTTLVHKVKHEAKPIELRPLITVSPEEARTFQGHSRYSISQKE